MKGSSQKKRSTPIYQTRTAEKRRSRRLLAVGAGVLLLLAVAGIALGLAPQGEGEAVRTGSGEKSKGAAAAQVVVEEFADFQCPACRRFFESPARLLEKEYVSAGKVKFVFRHYAFLGQESRWAAEASECANEQGRFWDFYEKLFMEQAGENVGVFSKQNLQRFAAELGLDTTTFGTCLTSGKYTERVLLDMNEAGSRGVRGTPTLFINGQRVEGGSDYMVLRQSIEAALNAD